MALGFEQAFLSCIKRGACCGLKNVDIIGSASFDDDFGGVLGQLGSMGERCTRTTFRVNGQCR